MLAVGLQAAAMYRSGDWRHTTQTFAAAGVDLTQPDVLIRTESLSAFFRDLLQVPLARDVLGEDLLFYYETHPDRLGLAGSLRRIAYEHDLTWTDRVVSAVFDEPAEILLWRGPKGALDYWAIAMSRGSLARVLQEAATIAGKDRQLTLAGHVTVDGASVQIFALEYAANRFVLVGAHRDRMIVLSHPGMLADGVESVREQAAHAVARMLSGDARQRTVYERVFPGAHGDSVHSVAARAHFLSFGYQHFFPGIEGLRFDFGSGRWSTALLTDTSALPGGAIDDKGLWTALPANAALCVLLPIDWSQGRAIAAAAFDPAHSTAVDVTAALDGPAAACWYEHGRIHTPLFAATLKNPRPDLAPLMTTLFDWGIRRPEDAPAVVAAHPATDETTWQRDIQVPFASLDAESGRPVAGPLRVTLASKGRYVFFSPDGAHVARALDTVRQRYPSMADLLPREGVTLAFVAPRALAALGRSEALVMLPPPDEPVFRAAAERHLLPRLERMSRYPSYRLALESRTAQAKTRDQGRGWQAVMWQELAR